MLTDGSSLGGGVELDSKSGRPPTAPSNVTETRHINNNASYL